MVEKLGEWIPVHSFPGLSQAFEVAVRDAKAGEVVLLSPACSSFDQYQSYSQRGDHFQRLVSQLDDERKDA